MDYSKIYIELMERATDRVIDGYTERHHIVPKCMGGDDKPRNLVALTPEEHFLAHQLLAKIYPNNGKLVYACQAMTMASSSVVRSNKMYGWLKRKHSNIQRDRMLGSTPWNKGLKMSQDYSDRMAQLAMGNTNMLGKRHTVNARSKMSDGHKGKKHTIEHRMKISEANIGRKFINRKGGKRGSYKLSDSQINEIINLKMESSISNRKIAKLYDVSRDTIGRIINPSLN